jgi:ligand-binding SRPBCC domain-containing protein
VVLAPLFKPGDVARMNERHLREELLVPRPIGEVFDFFAQARNLEILTPPWLKFEVLTPEPITMRVGLTIDYRIHVHGLPVRWRTKIEAWEPPHRFIDMQLRGPYRLWHHTHTFEERDGGTLCRDEVRYWPIGGALIDTLFVSRDVKAIFEFRRQRLLEIFAPARD